MKLLNLIGWPAYNSLKSIPSQDNLDKKLTENEFKKKMSEKFSEYFSRKELTICNKAYALKYGRIILECYIDENNKLYNQSFPEEIKYEIAAEMDLLIIKEGKKDEELYVFEHKRGLKELSEDVLTQIIRYLIIISSIKSDIPVIGEVYLGGTGKVVRVGASIKKNGNYYLVLFKYGTKEYSDIIRLNKEFVEKVVYYPRKVSKTVIEEYIY